MTRSAGRGRWGALVSVAVLFALTAAVVPLMRAQPGGASARMTARPAGQSMVPRPMAQSATQGAESVPAYHSAPAKGPLPATLAASGFADPLTKKAYAVAAKMKPVLYQLPCYCRCDQAAGHTSLLSCYTDLHGSECEICKKEVFYTYEQRRKGKTAKQIRAGIIRGEWEKVDLGKYAPPLSSGGRVKK